MAKVGVCNLVVDVREAEVRDGRLGCWVESVGLASRAVKESD
jgi:hypothetical protein